MKLFKWWRKKDLELQKDAEEAKLLKAAVEFTLNGESEWMLTKKENGKKKAFDCSCVEHKETS